KRLSLSGLEILHGRRTTMPWRCCDALNHQRLCCAAITRSMKVLAELRSTGKRGGLRGHPRYDFLNRVHSSRKRGALSASIASLRAARSRYIGDARTKAGLQEPRKNC